MKNKTEMRVKNIVITTICAALISGGAAMSVRAAGVPTGAGAGTENGAETESGTAGAEAERDSGGRGIKTAAAADSREDGITKEETVWILAGADGSVEKIIVSDWLKNPSGEDKISDVSALINVENVKGDEEYAAGPGNALTWDAKGSDIYYRGNIDKELPVEVSVTCTLDGKEIAPEELPGKSGKVTIRYEYTNRQYEYAEIGGVRTKIYVPFAVLTGMVLDNEVFTNVEVTGGRMVNDGGITAVAAVSLPGLRDNLGIDPDKLGLDLPDFVEVTADVREFEPGMTFLVVTNEVFGKKYDEERDYEDSLRGLTDELADAMEQLTDGSDELYEGLCTLLDKSGELTEGIDKLVSGAAELRTGAGDLDNGAAKLQDGAAALQSGLNTLVSNNDQLNGGAGQVFETLLATAQTQLSAQLSSAGISVPGLTVDNYGEVLDGIIGSLDGAAYQQALAKVTAAVEQNRPAVEAAVTSAVRDQVSAQVAEAVGEQVMAGVLASMGMTREEYQAADETVKAQIDGAVSQQMAGMQSQIDAAVEEQMKSEAVTGLIASNTEAKIQELIVQNMQSNPDVQAALAAASEGVKAVASLKASLDSYAVFYRGLQSYTAGVSQAAAGAGDLKNGTDELRNGTGKLSAGAGELLSGIQTLKDATPALKDGITQLRDGAARLSDGLKEFDEKAVQRLAEAVDGDLENLTERLHAMTDVSENYKSFSGIGEDMDGHVKFIYRLGED